MRLRSQFTLSAVAARCILFGEAVLSGWLLCAGSRWLGGAYDVQDWLRSRHLGLMNDVAEIIAFIGPIQVMALSGFFGAVIVVALHSRNPPLLPVQEPRSRSYLEPGGPAPLS